MKNRLVVLTQTYPFGTGETFLETEARYWNLFDEVMVCPLAVTKDARKVKRLLPSSVDLVDLHYEGLSKCGWMIELVRFCFSRVTWHELVKILRSAPQKLHAIRKLLSLTVHTNAQSVLLEKELRRRDANVKTIMYAYWLYEPALMSIIMKKRINAVSAVSRVHRFDLYEERGIGYIPLRDEILSNIDRVFCISESGKRYLTEKHQRYSSKYYVRRLGTSDHGIQLCLREKNQFKLVSCSNCIPVKRIQLIIEALAILADRGKVLISWHHFGAGELLDSLQELAEKKLKEKVDYCFMGSIQNEILLETYKKGSYDLFLNVSSSEGIPVSIMEAMSFGIPCIATNVGGTSELVKDGVNGYLLSHEFLPEDLANRLEFFTNLSDEQYNRLREAARKHWADAFLADKNYKKFARELLALGG